MSHEKILTLSREAHDLTETAYRAHPGVKGDATWPAKQRLLLADMALHLMQTAMRDGELDTAKLQNNLYAILTISAPFLPEKELARYADAILKAD
jgi:hypothetical protein